MTAAPTHTISLDDLLEGDGVRFAAELSIPEDAPVRVVTLSEGHLEDRAKLHVTLLETLGFPGHYGHNWDALADVLTDPSWAEGIDGVVVVVDAQAYARHAETLDVLASIVQDAQT
ncbi:MAG: RNAse (barnase) inhibitor barstar, partial [Myxococcota bacterium]